MGTRLESRARRPSGLCIEKQKLQAAAGERDGLHGHQRVCRRPSSPRFSWKARGARKTEHNGAKGEAGTTKVVVAMPVKTV